MWLFGEMGTRAIFAPALDPHRRGGVCVENFPPLTLPLSLECRLVDLSPAGL